MHMSPRFLLIHLKMLHMVSLGFQLRLLILETFLKFFQPLQSLLVFRFLQGKLGL